MSAIYCSTLFLRQEVRDHVLVWVFHMDESKSVGSNKHFCYTIKVTTELIWKVLKQTQIADFKATGRSAPFNMIMGANGFLPGSEGRRYFWRRLQKLSENPNGYLLLTDSDYKHVSLEQWCLPGDRWKQFCLSQLWGEVGGRYQHMVLEAKPSTVHRTAPRQSRGRQVLL